MTPSQGSSPPCPVALTKEPQEVRGPVDLGHGSVGVIRQDLGVLRPLELVQQLGAQHHIEVLLDPSHHLVDSVFPADRELCKACPSNRDCSRARLGSGRSPRLGGSFAGIHILQGNLSADLKIYSHRERCNSRPLWKMGCSERSQGLGKPRAAVFSHPLQEMDLERPF